jgi:trk system potassium uptake protein TrkA
MKKQCLVIGLGIFGMSVARKLAEDGAEVLAIDKNIKLVEKASNFVEKAICMNITSLDSLSDLPLDDFDIAVVGIGENISISMLTCLALKETKINYIIAKAGDKLHKEVLKKIEVDEIVLPEEDVGNLIAESIMKKNLKEIKK